jgi:hypothetical protein
VPSVIDEDEAWFSASALGLKNPLQYFQRAIDNKPPGTVIFYWVCGGDLRIARLAMIGLSTLTAFVLAGIHRKISRPDPEDSDTFWNIALLFMVCSVIPSFELFSVTNEGLLLFFEVVSLFLILETGALPLIGSALAFGFGLLIKPTAAFFLLPLGITFFRSGRRWRESVCWAIFAAVFFEFSVLALGPADFWYWTVVYPAEILTRARSQLFQGDRDFLVNAVRFSLLLLPLLWVAARNLFRSPANRIFYLAWILSGLAGVVLGKGLFLHYFLLVLPPLCLLAGEEGFNGWKKYWLGFLYGFACLLIAVPGVTSFWGMDLLYHEKLARVIREVVAPKDDLFVWGGSAVPLALSQKNHATAFVTSRFLVPPYTTPEIQRRFLSEFVSQRPALVLDLSERGDNRFNFPVSELPGFYSELKSQYDRAEDPSLPWAHFYFLKGRPLPSGFVSQGETEVGADLILEWERAWRGKPAELSWFEWFSKTNDLLGATWASRTLRLGSGDTLALQLKSFLERPRGSAQELSQLKASVLDRYRRSGFREPYALSSPLAWVGLSIVHFQPVSVPRR